MSWRCRFCGGHGEVWACCHPRIESDSRRREVFAVSRVFGEDEPFVRAKCNNDFRERDVRHWLDPTGARNVDSG